MQKNLWHFSTCICWLGFFFLNSNWVNTLVNIGQSHQGQLCSILWIIYQTWISVWHQKVCMIFVSPVINVVFRLLVSFHHNKFFQSFVSKIMTCRHHFIGLRRIWFPSSTNICDITKLQAVNVWEGQLCTGTEALTCSLIYGRFIIHSYRSNLQWNYICVPQITQNIKLQIQLYKCNYKSIKYLV